MINMISRVRWTLIFMALFTAFVAPKVADALISAYKKSSDLAYDKAHPVVIMSAVLVERGPDFVVLKIDGEKPKDELRKCRYEYMQFFSLPFDGSPQPVTGTAMDVEDEGKTKPTGQHYDLGRWRVSPVISAKRVTTFVTHDCDGRLITTQIADVGLDAVLKKGAP